VYFLIAANLTIKLQSFMLLLLPNFQRTFGLFSLPLIGGAKVSTFILVTKNI
jgi:hypothetical protein